MPGLLDAFNNDDARLGIGLLAAAGPSATPLSFGQRLQGALGAFDANKLQQKKLGLLDAQMDNLKSESATRQAALAKQQALLDLFNPQPTAPGASMLTTQPGQLGSGSFGIVSPPAGAPAIPQSPAAGTSRIGSLTPDKLAQLKLLGVDMTDVYKLTQPDMQVSNGYAYDRRTVQPGFLPQVNVSANGQVTQVTPDASGGVGVTMPKGSLEAYSAFRNADEAAKAGSDLVKVYNPVTQREEFVSRSQVLGRQAPQPTVSPPTASLPSPQAGVQGAYTGDPESVQAAISAIRDPQERANAQAAFDQQARRTPGFASGGRFAAGQSTGEKLSAEAGGKVNESFIKSRYEPTLAAGDAANDMLTNVQVARSSMRAMGGTGWGAEAKATGASVLAGLGIAPKNAKLYAANAETFQNAAMSNLQTVLNAAKGPQTEGDATRASKTFASLRNTPQANEFILDLAEAKATREQMKARFFQQALPIAQSKGDLAEVEREWIKRAPSVFSMPSMQKWGKQ